VLSIRQALISTFRFFFKCASNFHQMYGSMGLRNFNCTAFGDECFSFCCSNQFSVARKINYVWRIRTFYLNTLSKTPQRNCSRDESLWKERSPCTHRAPPRLLFRELPPALCNGTRLPLSSGAIIGNAIWEFELRLHS
jgi:hypothetical protein